MKKILLFILAICFSQFIYGQSSSATYSTGDIPTSYLAYDASCNGPVTTLDVTIPAGMFVTGIDVSYDMTAATGAWMSEQNSQIYCQDTGLDEGAYVLGSGGNSGGTESYSRTGLNIANGVDADGLITFEMRAFRSWGSADGGVCNLQYQQINNNTWTITVHYINPPSCLPTSNLVANNVFDTSADISWTENGTATAWDIEFGPTGFTPTGTPTAGYDDVNSTMATLTGLSDVTDYDVYVRADCGMDNTSDVAIWIGPLTFTTLASLPVCGDNITGLCYSQTGVQEVLVNFSVDNPGDWALLTFNAGQVETCCDEVLVYDGLNGTGNILYGSLTGGGLADYSGEGTIISTTGFLSLVINSDGSVTCGTSGYTPFDVTVNCTPPPTCLAPSDFTASNITATTADLAWITGGSGETAWDIEWGPTGFTPTGTPTNDNVPTNPYTLSALPSSSTLDIYVRADCSLDDTDASFWTGPITITTACVAFTSFPACEDFAAPGIPNCWAVQGPADWEVGTAGWGAEFAGDHTPGGGTNYIFADGTDVPDGESIELYTPFYDVSSLNAPYLSYWVFSNNEDDPGDNNTLTVEMWDGTGWILAETIQGDYGGWTEFSIDVNQTATITGNEIQFRFTFISTTIDNDYENDILLDDVCVKERPENDMAITAITAPASGCGLGMEDITIEVSNLGFQTQGGFFTNYSVNGVVQTAIPDGFITSNIISANSISYTFATQYDFSAPGTYTIQAWTELPTEQDFTNDTATVVITNVPVISALPYTNDFESGDGGFQVENLSGISSIVWELGAPSGAAINTANSGVNAFVTNLAGNYENNTETYLTSPCMDFSNYAVDPELSFAYIIESETNWDGMWVDISIDGGTTWERLGSSADPTWYNNTTGDEFFDGNTGGWNIATHSLDGSAGEGNVKIRFVFDSDGSSSAFDGAGVDDISIIDVCVAGFNLAATTVDETKENTSADGEASITPGTGEAPYSYMWSNGETTNTISGVETGTYTVTVTDTNGCQDVLAVYVGFECLASIVDDISYIPETQNTVTSDGSITISTSSSAAPYDYVWSNGMSSLGDASNSNTISGLQADIYYVTITDANGCSDVSSVVVTSTCAVNLAATYTSSDESVVGAGDGAITVTPNSGTAPYSYDWSTGGSGDTESNLPAGTHSVTITDANGCFEVVSVVIGSTCPASLGVTTTSTDETVEGFNNGTASASTSNGEIPFSYQWSNGETGNTILDLAPGDYTVTVTDANGCNETAMVTIAVGNSVNVANITALSNINIMPNPTRDFTTLQVAFSETVDLEVELMTMLGQKVERFEFNNTSSENVMLDLTNVPSGIYFVILKVEGNFHIERIMKSN